MAHSFNPDRNPRFCTVCDHHVSNPVHVKSAGQLAYERDCILTPNYNDGSRRIGWDALPGFAQQSWEKNPTTSDEEQTAQRHEEILAGLASERAHSRIREANGRAIQWTYNTDGSMAKVTA